MEKFVRDGQGEYDYIDLRQDGKRFIVRVGAYYPDEADEEVQPPREEQFNNYDSAVMYIEMLKRGYISAIRKALRTTDIQGDMHFELCANWSEVLEEVEQNPFIRVAVLVKMRFAFRDGTAYELVAEDISVPLIATGADLALIGMSAATHMGALLQLLTEYKLDEVIDQEEGVAFLIDENLRGCLPDEKYRLVRTQLEMFDFASLDELYADDRLGRHADTGEELEDDDPPIRTGEDALRFINGHLNNEYGSGEVAVERHGTIYRVEFRAVPHAEPVCSVVYAQAFQSENDIEALYEFASMMGGLVEEIDLVDLPTSWFKTQVEYLRNINWPYIVIMLANAL